MLVTFIACVLKKPDLDEEDTDEDINKVLQGGAHAVHRDEASLSRECILLHVTPTHFCD